MTRVFTERTSYNVVIHVRVVMQVIMWRDIRLHPSCVPDLHSIKESIYSPGLKMSVDYHGDSTDTFETFDRIKSNRGNACSA